MSSGTKSYHAFFLLDIFFLTAQRHPLEIHSSIFGWVTSISMIEASLTPSKKKEKSLFLLVLAKLFSRDEKMVQRQGRGGRSIKSASLIAIF